MSRPQPVPARGNGPAGALIVRVWREGAGADQLRIRLVARADVTRAEEDTRTMASIADSIDYIRAWLQNFAGPG